MKKWKNFYRKMRILNDNVKYGISDRLSKLIVFDFLSISSQLILKISIRKFYEVPAWPELRWNIAMLTACTWPKVV